MASAFVPNTVNAPSDEGLKYLECSKEFTFMQGIDFIYNEICRTLRNRVRCSRVESELDLVSSVVGLTQRVLMIPYDQPEIVPTVVPGDFFC